MNETPDVSIRSNADLVAAIPYLVGYQPDNALVIIGVGKGRIVFISTVPLCHPHQVWAGALEAHCLNGADALLIAGYGPEPEITPAAAALKRLLPSGWQPEIPDIVRVEGNRYWSYECPDPQCCSPDGEVIDVKSSRVAAEFTVAGKSTVSSRQDLLAELAPAGNDDLIHVLTAMKAVVDRHKGTDGVDTDSPVFADAGCDHLDGLIGGAGLPEHEAIADTLVYLAAPATRGHAIDQIDTADINSVRALWIWITRHAPSRFQAAPAALAAYACWRTGDGSAITKELLHLSLKADSDRTANALAFAVQQALLEAIPPRVAPRFADLKLLTQSD